MSSGSTLVRYCPLRGWFFQRYREPLSLAAQNRLFSHQSSRPAGFQPARITGSTNVNCNTATIYELVPFLQASANHSIPIGPASCGGSVQSVFSAPTRPSTSSRSQCICAPRRYAKNALHYVKICINARIIFSVDRTLAANALPPFIRWLAQPN